MSCEGFCKTIPCTCKEMWNKAFDSIRTKQKHGMAEAMIGIVRDKLANPTEKHSVLMKHDVCPVCLRSFHLCDCNLVDQAEAYKQTVGKHKWSLLSFKGLEGIVAVRQFGVSKYGDSDSWKHVERQKYLDAAMRHMVAVFNGEENDAESGLPHIAHAQCNLMFISAIDKENKK